MMQPAQIRSTLERHLSKCEVVDEGIFRCEKRMPGAPEPYAIYYVDSTGTLPSGKEQLLSYEEKYLADWFYRQPRHLRWNHYLVFALEKAEWKRAATTGVKRDLERDTAYARKFVITLDGLEEFFGKPKQLLPTQEKPEDDATQRLLDALRSSGLDQMVFARYRNRAIDAWLSGDLTAGSAIELKPRPPVSPRTEDAKKLLELKWTKFRKYPERKEYRFGKVNLIFGPNGSGKTSLLEAIETFF
jgi:DNA repair protein SbcC/Rad50